jgi:beta-glucanase (GH16 family)
MRFFYSIIFVSLFFSTSSFSQSWNLIWSDEFNGSSLDTAKWIHDIGTGSQYGLYGWGNSELQYYQPQNTVLDSGSVKIIANVEPNGIVDSWNNTMYYSSSKITTKGTFDFRYGKVEARIKTIDGQGFWPAFWMLPTGGNWPCDGEIDVMEQWGSDGSSNTTTGAAHVGTCPGISNYQSSSNVISSGSYADNFHTYSIQWHPDQITWYVDNIQFLQVTPSSYPNNTWPFNSNNWYLMFNLAITSSGPNLNTVFPSQIEIDYVRVYENIGGILGCIDSTAENYNIYATIDNGSCEYMVTFEVNLNCENLNITPNAVNITGPSNGWSCQSNTLSDLDGDGIWNGSFVLPLGNFEYIYCADNWSQSENLLSYGSGTGDWSCTPITDYWSYANRQINIQGDTTIFNTWGSCNSCIGGCLDPLATNYNPSSNYDDGSCNYNNNFNVTFQVDMNNVANPFTLPEVNGTFNNWCGSCASLTDVNNDNVWDITLSVPAGYYEYKFSSDNWTIQEDLLNAGNCVVSAWGYTNRFLNITSDTILDLVCWGSCAECISSSVYGCTDPLATNYDSSATIDDGSCIYPSNCTYPSPTGAYISELIHDRVRVNWDNMNDANCMVTQYRIRYREVGASAWSTKTMSGSVLCVYGLNTTSKKILGLMASTTYEYYMKAWYCGGGVSGWSAIQNFTTLDLCQNVINFAVTSPSTTKASFTWDTTAAYSFARIKLRVDTTGGVWTTAGGFGVMYPTLNKDKNGLTPGTSYRAQARTWCDPTGGAYRSTVWTPLIFWTQLTTVRLEGGSPINNLAIYPNPSRNIFNVSFTSVSKQDLRIRIMNVIGEELINENLEQFVGNYTKQINLSANAKGIYFLEIKLDDNLIVNKLVLF